MKPDVKIDCKSKAFSVTKNYTRLVDKDLNLVNFKSYQKLFAFLISFSTILISPELPREIGNICESYNSRQICNVW